MNRGGITTIGGIFTALVLVTGILANRLCGRVCPRRRVWLFTCILMAAAALLGLIAILMGRPFTG